MSEEIKDKMAYSKKDSCFYSNGIVCEKRSKCGSCGWNPEIDKQRREREHIKEKHWWVDPTFMEKPLATERIVLEKGL